MSGPATVFNHVLRNTYRDSVVLMRLSRELEGGEGVRQATAMMGTPNNRELLRAVGLLAGPGEAATANDLIIAMELDTPEGESEALAKAEALLDGGARGPTNAEDYRPRSLDGALQALPGANLALISLPGEYAAGEARRALERGLNVLLFSDNVSVTDEVALKQFALKQGLLMLGPDCGTTILQGVPLGFANAVPRGRVGLVSASGTGLQQVACLLAASGEGVSQALGVGGRDMSGDVGGLMMLEGLRLLQEDDDTEVVTLISKPPGQATAHRLMQALRGSGKPCVLAFIGAQPQDYGPNVHVAATLEAAARRVLEICGEICGAQALPQWASIAPEVLDRLQVIADALPAGPRYVRGLFSGGTLCYEALWTLQQGGLDLHSNLALDGVEALPDHNRSQGHTMVDLGDDRYTVGRPHPMIDFRPRCQRLVQEASDPEVAVALLDVVLGYGAHPDPASELAPALEQAKRVAADDGRELACVVSLCGSAGDPQSLSRQEEQLGRAGALVVHSNALAARIALALSRNDLSSLSRS